MNLNGTDTTIPVFEKAFNYAITLQDGANTMQVRATSALIGCYPPKTAEGISPSITVTYDSGSTAVGSVSGQVTNSYTGNQVSNARVVAEGTNQETRTDANGNYGFAQLPAGDVTIRAEP